MEESPVRKSYRRLVGVPYSDEDKIEAKKDAFLGAVLCAVVFIVALFILFICLPTKAHAEQIDMEAIAQIESSNNPKAYNQRSGAIGLCQVMPIVLKEYNSFNKVDYKKDDLFIKALNLDVADWYMNYRIPQMLKAYKIPDSARNRLIAYNFGIGNLKKGKALPNETKSYIVKYEEITNGK